jgi:hypothetical protein
MAGQPGRTSWIRGIQDLTLQSCPELIDLKKLPSQDPILRQCLWRWGMSEATGSTDVRGLEHPKDAARPLPSSFVARSADPDLLLAVSAHMGQPRISPDEVHAIMREQYALRVYEDGLDDTDESWEAFLAHWASWANESPSHH